MKDAYFKGIQWARTFGSGPLDPVHNKFKFYCMLCKTNVSIYAKGAREILRHYRTEGHLRRDQKWRYTHLQETDEVTGIITHQVRGRDGYVLTPIELEKEKPFFMEAPLVEAGDRFPFYDDYMASIGGVTDPDDLRNSTLISLIGTFVPQDDNFSLLRMLWTNVGQFTNHQALFSSFDWGSATLTVSILSLQVLVTDHRVHSVSKSFLSFHFRTFSTTFSCEGSLISQDMLLPVICTRSNSRHRRFSSSVYVDPVLEERQFDQGGTAPPPPGRGLPRLLLGCNLPLALFYLLQAWLSQRIWVFFNGLPSSRDQWLLQKRDSVPVQI